MEMHWKRSGNKSSKSIVPRFSFEKATWEMLLHICTQRKRKIFLKQTNPDDLAVSDVFI